MKATLVLFKADGQRREFSISHPKTILGRKPDCNLQISFPSISREHCCVEIRNGTIFLRDMGSSNGTFHNGTRLGKQEVQLEAGDAISMGPVNFRLVIDGQPENLEPPVTQARATSEETVDEQAAPAPAQAASLVAQAPEVIEMPEPSSVDKLEESSGLASLVEAQAPEEVPMEDEAGLPEEAPQESASAPEGAQSPAASDPSTEADEDAALSALESALGASGSSVPIMDEPPVGDSPFVSSEEPAAEVPPPAPAPKQASPKAKAASKPKPAERKVEPEVEPQAAGEADVDDDALGALADMTGADDASGDPSSDLAAAFGDDPEEPSSSETEDDAAEEEDPLAALASSEAASMTESDESESSEDAKPEKGAKSKGKSKGKEKVQAKGKSGGGLMKFIWPWKK